MIDLGLTSAQMRQLFTLLASNHFIFIRVQVLDLSGTYLTDLSTRLLGGQVNVDTTGDITRSLELDLLDPDRRLNFDSNAPDDGAMYADRMVKIIYTVQDSARTYGFDIPIFCGPVTKMDRNGPVVSIEAQGKERLSSANLWSSRTFKKGTNRVAALRALLVDSGENKFDLAASRASFPRNFELTRAHIPWVVAKNSIAAGLGFQLFYDGRGVARLRNRSSQAVFTFTESVLVSEPQISFNIDDLVNAVEVIGAKPKGSKTKVSYRVTAPRSHPLSPWTLGRNGKPRYLPLVVEDDSLKTKAACRARALKELNSKLIEAVSVAFDTLPIPLLEENDVCRLSTRKFSTNFILSQFTIPLVSSGTSSIGYLKRSTPARAQIRRS